MGRGQDIYTNELQERPRYAKKNPYQYADLSEIFSLFGVARRNNQSFFVLQNLGESKVSAILDTVAGVEELPLAHFDLREDETFEELLDGELGEALGQPFVVHIKSDGLHDEEFARLAHILNAGVKRVFEHDGKSYPIHEDTLLFLESNNLNKENIPDYQSQALVVGEAWLRIKRESGQSFSPFRKIAAYKKAGYPLFLTEKKDSLLPQETANHTGLPFFEIDLDQKQSFQEKFLKSFNEILESPSVVYIKSKESNQDVSRFFEGIDNKKNRESILHKDSFVFLERSALSSDSKCKSFISLGEGRG